MLKLLFHRETRKLLGVHVIGESATEIIHIGQAVMALGGTIDYFRDTVFNYPTMAECYKVAALDGLNKLSLWAEAETRRRDAVVANATRRRCDLACRSGARVAWQTRSPSGAEHCRKSLIALRMRCACRCLVSPPAPRLPVCLIIAA